MSVHYLCLVRKWWHCCYCWSVFCRFTWQNKQMYLLPPSMTETEMCKSNLHIVQQPSVTFSPCWTTVHWPKNKIKFYLSCTFDYDKIRLKVLHINEKIMLFFFPPAFIQWDLPARAGGRGRLWVSGGRHQAGGPAFVSTGETNRTVAWRLVTDIFSWRWHLAVRCLPQACSHCRKKGACVGCSVKSCRKMVHLPCSRAQRFLCQFTGLFP